MSKVFEISGATKIEIAKAMAAHIAPFVAAINVIGSDEWTSTEDVASGRGWGTGNYASLRGKPYILTNEHVAIARSKFSLGHALRNLEDPDNKAFRIINPFQAVPHPVDAAITRIDEEVWALGQKSAIPSDRIAATYAPVPGERL